MRDVFSDISKASDKVWHIRLLSNLKPYGVEGELLFILVFYLRDGKQRVVWNGDNSNWRKINSSVRERIIAHQMGLCWYGKSLLRILHSFQKHWYKKFSKYS